MDLFKNQKFWVGMGLATLVTIFLGDLASFVFVGSCIGIWYFKKKKPNRDYSTISICLAVMSFFVIGVSGAGAESNDSAAPVVTVDESSSESVESLSEEELSAIEESKQKEEEKAKAESESREEEERKKAESESIAAAEKEDKEAELEKKTKEIQGAAPSVPDGAAYVEVNSNIPLFTNEDIISTETWDEYGTTDSLGRVTVANAVLGTELMPAEERGDISDVYPTGWNQAEYANVSGGWLYNRSHLIGHQLTGYDGANNLITGTRYFNVEGMLPFENFVANYIETTDNHVRYRITPHFEGDNLLASGVYMEGFSIEDNGEGLQFHIYVPNVQPGVTLDYTTGDSWSDEPVIEEESVEEEIPEEPVVEEAPAPAGGDVSSVDANGNGNVTIQEAKDAGFAMPLYSDHWLYPYMDDRDNDGMVGE